MGASWVLVAGFKLAAAQVPGQVPAQALPELPELPDWMAGCWLSETEAAWVEECWTPARGGMMLGTNRGGKRAQPDAPASWEMMQIGPVRPEAGPALRGLAFRASLRGSEWTAFEMAAGAGPGVTFLNTAHDYPQRIQYWREGEMLRARVSLEDGSEPMEWTFRKAP